MIRRRAGRGLYQPASSSTVALVKGSDRRDNIYRSLKLIEDQVFSPLGDKQILIKPNFVQTSVPLAATHADAIRGILDFLAPHYKKEVIIGEAAATKEGTFAGYKNYSYQELAKDYKVKLVDLNLGGYQYRYTMGEKNAPVPIRICSSFLDPNLYIISAAVLKTHGYASVTLSLKNMLLGAPINDYTTSDKSQMHRGPHGEPDDIIHFNMFHMAQEVFPDLAVIDGFTGMEGDGPSRGTPVDSLSPSPVPMLWLPIPWALAPWIRRREYLISHRWPTPVWDKATWTRSMFSAAACQTVPTGSRTLPCSIFRRLWMLE